MAALQKTVSLIIVRNAPLGKKKKKDDKRCT